MFRAGNALVREGKGRDTLCLGQCHVRKLPAYLMFGLYLLYMTYQFAAAFGAPITICFDSVNICI